MQFKKLVFAAGVAGFASVMSVPAHAQLNILCSVQVEWCTAATAAFEKQTGIKVSMTQKGSGETFAQINAEKENPKTDLWFGGTATRTCRRPSLD
jgi:iron(III) transport system substrate-binding protein